MVDTSRRQSRASFGEAAPALLAGALFSGAIGLHAFFAPAPTDPGVGLPSAILHVASLGHGHAMAHAQWSAEVRAFSVYGPNCLRTQERVHAIGALDPDFAAPFAYGALMCHAGADRTGYQALLAEGAERFPMSPWFPTTLASSLLWESGDTDRALRWYREAARRPGVDPMVSTMVQRLDPNP